MVIIIAYRWVEENCPICKGQMMSSPYQGYGYCPRCQQYHVAQSPWAGQRSRGIWITERCMYCYKPIVDTADPSINYCPYCGKYQYDKIGY